jgi:osmotically-inducible protein OsmY
MAKTSNKRLSSVKILPSRLLFVIIAAVMSACIPIAVGVATVTAIDLAYDTHTIGQKIDDNSLEVKLRADFLTDDQLGTSENISVTAINGIVLLTGEVHTDAQRQHASALAKSRVETREVVNELELSGKTNLTSRANDSYITGKVKSKMIAADGVPSSNIKVVTERSKVYLLGLVTKAEADAAVEVAKSVRGVTHIVKVFEYIS